MKKLVKLNNVKVLRKEELKSINGGWDSGFCARFCANNPDPTDWRYDRCGCTTVISDGR